MHIYFQLWTLQQTGQYCCFQLTMPRMDHRRARFSAAHSSYCLTMTLLQYSPGNTEVDSELRKLSTNALEKTCDIAHPDKRVQYILYKKHKKQVVAEERQHIKRQFALLLLLLFNLIFIYIIINSNYFSKLLS